MSFLFDSPRDTQSILSTEEEECHINILTEDILLEIIFMLLSNYPKSHHAHRTIMAVSSRWRELVIKNPLCWTHVNIGSNIYPTVMSSFTRSGPAQLVDVTMDFHTMTANDVSVQEACSVTMKHHNQIRSLEVLNLPHWMTFAYFLEIWKRNGTTTPNLKIISIAAAHRHSNLEDITLRVFPKDDNKWLGAISVECLTLMFFNPFVLPRMKNLKFLEMSTVGVPNNVLGHIFDASPLLETLVLHQYEAHGHQNHSTNHPIIAPSLRYLAIGNSKKCLSVEHTRDDFSRLSIPNLEGLEVLHCKWCTRRFQHLGNLPKLRRIRMREFDYRDIEFLASLPPTVTLEIVRMPTTSFDVPEVLNLSNLACIIWSFEDRTYGFEARTSFRGIWDIVRGTRQRANAPTIMVIPPGREPPNDVLAILGSNFVMRTSSKWEPWLLKNGGLDYDLH